MYCGEEDYLFGGNGTLIAYLSIIEMNSICIYFQILLRIEYFIKSTYEMSVDMHSSIENFARNNEDGCDDVINLFKIMPDPEEKPQWTKVSELPSVKK